MDPHTFLTDPDLAVFSNADPDPATVLSAFFLLFFSPFFPSGSGSARETECGFRIHSPG